MTDYTVTSLANRDDHEHIGTCNFCGGRVLVSPWVFLSYPPKTPRAFCETCKRKEKLPESAPLPVIEMEP